MKLKKETLRWLLGQDKITSRCVHVLGFVYALYFINYLCFFLTFHRVRLTNNSGLSLRSTDWKSTLSPNSDQHYFSPCDSKGWFTRATQTQKQVLVQAQANTGVNCHNGNANANTSASANVRNGKFFTRVNRGNAKENARRKILVPCLHGFFLMKNMQGALGNIRFFMIKSALGSEKN